eukprot:TRINITY_DN1099_c0_g1_i4.p1 TRINITY_DN1099_c0_g1~~TRINITY_DN1099_c0_g1_i4.p1  ORF type:complete len:515 (-),score=119.43 TRINITY_DN1099_c0_g1_i4:34-1578(-)
MARDATLHEPRLIHVDPWGKRVDRIETSKGWTDLHRVSAEEGLVAIGYERKHGEFSRVHQFAKLYLYNPSSAVQTCPLAMTDGAARLIELEGTPDMKSRAYRFLTTRNFDEFWTSGQWMTERTGGSDVSQTETIAVPNPDGSFRLFGTKYFTSATTSEMAMTLARIQDPKTGKTIPGSAGLSCFYLETRKQNGDLNEIRVLRLKDKFGTRALPTAELELLGTPAVLIGQAGKGVRVISSLFNITRIYNAVSSAAAIRRGVALCRDYGEKRMVFGSPLIHHTLHQATIAEMYVHHVASLHFSLHVAHLLGKTECSVNDKHSDHLLRFLTPLVKLFTAKQAVAQCSELLESFGGAGYMEDTGLPAIFRDAQVLAIWEGTTNVLSLDVLRAISKDKESLAAYLSSVSSLLAAARRNPALQTAVTSVDAAVAKLHVYLRDTLNAGAAEATVSSARIFAYGLSRIYVAALLLSHASKTSAEIDIGAACRWTEMHDLAPFFVPTEHHRKLNRLFAIGSKL